MEQAREQITIAAAPDHCLAVTVDFERYPEWAKDVREAKVTERDTDGRGLRVEYRAAALGRSTRYVLAYDFADAPASFSWKLVEGDMLRRLDGRYRFSASGSGTRVTYELAAEPSIPIPGMLKRRAASRIVGTALKELKREAEKG